jgi:hypothetical protein
VTVEVGDWDLGVRFSTPETAAVARRLFGAHVRPELAAPANYSLHEADVAAPGEAQAFHTLYRTESPASRSTSVDRLLGELAQHLATHTYDDRTDLLVVDAVAFLSKGRAVLFPPRLRRLAVAEQRRLFRLGIELRSPRRHLVDPRTGELVVEPAPLVLDQSALQNSAAETQQEVGRYPVATWFVRSSGRPGEPLRPAEAAVRLVGLVDNRPALGDQTALDAIGTLVQRVPAATTTSRPSDIGPLSLAALA